MAMVEVLLYVLRNCRLIRDGSPGRPPRLSHSSWALFFNVALRTQRPPYRLLGTGSPGRPPRLSHSSWALSVWNWGFMTLCSISLFIEDIKFRVCLSSDKRSFAELNPRCLFFGCHLALLWIKVLSGFRNDSGNLQSALPWCWEPWTIQTEYTKVYTEIEMIIYLTFITGSKHI